MLLSSCNDNNTNPSEIDSFDFPLAVGNEWTYGVYDLDENHEKIDDYDYKYSIRVTNKLNFRGKSAYEIEKDIPFNDKYYSVENSGIYLHLDYENMNSNEKIRYPDEWIKFYDFSKDYWTMYRKEMKLVNGNVVSKGTLSTYGSKTGEKTITIDGNDVVLYEFLEIFVSEEYRTENNVTEHFITRDTTPRIIADGIGLYSNKKKWYPDNEPFPDYGFEVRLIDYKLTDK